MALTSGAEDGHQIKVKLVFDPARPAIVSKLGLFRASELRDAPGIEVAIGDPSHAGQDA